MGEPERVSGCGGPGQSNIRHSPRAVRPFICFQSVGARKRSLFLPPSTGVGSLSPQVRSIKPFTDSSPPALAQRQRALRIRHRHVCLGFPHSRNRAPRSCPIPVFPIRTHPALAHHHSLRIIPDFAAARTHPFSIARKVSRNPRHRAASCSLNQLPSLPSRPLRLRDPHQALRSSAPPRTSTRDSQLPTSLRPHQLPPSSLYTKPSRKWTSKGKLKQVY